jgi:hypothetical protein
MSPQIIGALVGAGLGGVKGFGDQQAFDRNVTAQARLASLSPWTKYSVAQAQDAIGKSPGGMLSGMYTGAVTGMSTGGQLGMAGKPGALPQQAAQAPMNMQYEADQMAQDPQAQFKPMKDQRSKWTLYG